MKKRGKQKQLIILLIVILFVGIYFFGMGSKNNEEYDTNSQMTADNSSIQEKTDENEICYKENELVEISIYPSTNSFFKYDNNISILVNENKQENNKFINVNILKNEIVDSIFFENETVEACFIDNDFNYIVVHYDATLNTPIIKTYDKFGKTKNKDVILQGFKGTVWENKDVVIKKFKIDDEHIFLLSNTTTSPVLQIFNKNGTLHGTFEKPVYDFDIDNKGKIYMLLEHDKYVGFMKADIEKLEIDYFMKDADKRQIAYNEYNDKLYIVSDREIARYDTIDGNMEDVMFEFGVDSSYLPDRTEGNVITDFYIENDKSFYIRLYDYKNFVEKYYEYKIVKGKKDERPITLTITSPYKQDFLSDAIIRYEMRFPDQKIKYDYTYNSRDEFKQNSDIYSKQLTSKILTNDVGDIVMTGGSGLLYKDMFRTDAFIDLKEYIEKDKSYGNLNENILKSITIDNAIRGLPLSVLYLFCEVNLSLADELKLDLDYNNLSWSNVLSLIDKIEENNSEAYLFSTSSLNIESELTSVLIANIPQLIDIDKKNIDLNQKWFIGLIEALKIASKSNSFIEPIKQNNSFAEMQNSLFRTTVNFQSSSICRNYIEWYLLANKENKNTKYIPDFIGEKSNNRIAYTNNMYSISSSSKNKENAWNFLSFLLESDTQKIKSLPGLPINKKANDELFDLAVKEVLLNYSTDEEKNKIEEFLISIDNISNKIDYLYDYDYLKKDLADPIMEYINDKITLEKALEKAEKNAFIRLNE